MRANCLCFFQISKIEDNYYYGHPLFVAVCYLFIYIVDLKQRQYSYRSGRFVLDLTLRHQ